jgi:hypothetical protein
MIEEINTITEATGKYKVTTSHGTYYIFDLDGRRARRVPAPGRNALNNDTKWFNLKRWSPIEVGSSIHMYTIEDIYEWRVTTPVTSIEEWTE